MDPWRYEGTFYAVRNRNDLRQQLYHGSDPPCLDNIQNLDKSEQGYPPVYKHLEMCKGNIAKYPVKRVCEGECWVVVNPIELITSSSPIKLWKCHLLSPSHPRGHRGRRRSWLIGCQAHDAPTQSDWLKIWSTLPQAMCTWNFLMSSMTFSLISKIYLSEVQFNS